MSQLGNELEPGDGQAPASKPAKASKAQPEAPTPPRSPITQHFTSQHDAALARYEKLAKAGETLAKVRKIMDGLTAKQDMVSEEDVLEGGSELVAAGLGAAAVAGLLADMPQTSEGMQGWVQQHDQDVQKREAQLKQVLVLARHELGLTAMKTLIGGAAEDHFAAQAEQGQPSAVPAPTQAPPSSNPLSLGA